MDKDNRLLAEAYNKVTKKIGDIVSFEDLPEKRPYGFCVYSDGSIDISSDHERTLKNKGFRSYDDFYSKGGVRVVYEEGDFQKFYLMGDMDSSNSRIALRVAKDVAKWYQQDYDIDKLTRLNGTYIMD